MTAATKLSVAASGRGTVSVVELIAIAAESSPRSIALRCGSASMTYRDLMTAADQLAAELQGIGAGADVPVGICVERSFDHVIALLGALRAGSAFLPIDPAWPEERMRYVLDDARAPIVIAGEGAAGKLAGENRIVLVGPHDLRPKARVPRPADISGEDLAYIIYTSGSTGEPKGVEITHGNLLNLVTWHCQAFAISPSDRVSCLAGLSFDALVWEQLPCLAAGATLYMAPESMRTSAERLRQWLVEEEIAVAFVPTPLAEPLITSDWPQNTSLRTLLTGGDTLHVRPKPALPFDVVNNYGPTECTVVATSGVVPPDPQAAGLPRIGRPIANIRIHILDESGAPVAAGAIGEIYIGGASVGRGYRNRPSLTAEKFLAMGARPMTGADRLFRTGDLGSWTPDGQIAFHGRCDDQLKLRGHRIEPDEISAVLDLHPGVAQSAIVGHGDGLDKRLNAYVVPAGRTALRAGELRDFLSRQLPTYMLPGAFVRVASLPLTANGKLDRSALPSPTAADTLPSSVYRAPTTKIENRIVRIVEELLEIEHVGVDDNFFLLGGHSLLGTQLVLRVRETFGVELGLRDLFEAQTVANLAARVEQEVIKMVESMSEEDVRQRLVH